MKLRYTVAWVGCTAAALMVTYVAGAVPVGSGPVDTDVPGATAELAPTEAALPLPSGRATSG
jgi:hypothetical protein